MDCNEKLKARNRGVKLRSTIRAFRCQIPTYIIRGTRLVPMIRHRYNAPLLEKAVFHRRAARWSWLSRRPFSSVSSLCYAGFVSIRVSTYSTPLPLC